MEVIHPRCAGLDVSKKDAKVCIRVQGGGRRKTTSTVGTWSSMAGSVLELREYLITQQVSCVVMEATGDYWRPFYYVLEEGLNVVLANALEVKNVPGRKTDVSDATWLADLAAHGLVRASFVPPPPIRELRELTRARTVITAERSREVQRLEKLLEDTGIKLSAVASDVVGVSGRAILEALIAGQRDPAVLADLAKRKMRVKIPQLTEALVGRFTDHHRFMVRLFLDRIDGHSADIARLTERIEEALAPFKLIRNLLSSIPGVSTGVADVFIAETGADMSVFPTAAQLASWAGTTPGSHESAGHSKSTKTRPGDSYLKGALGIAAMSAAKPKNTYLSAKYKRIASRRGRIKAIVALEHSILISAWHMLTTGELYRDLGADYFTRRDPAKARARAIGQLEALGYHVSITEAAPNSHTETHPLT